MAIECEHCDTVNESDASFCIGCGKALKSADTVAFFQTEPFPQPDGPGDEGSTHDAFHLQPGDQFAGRYTIVDTIGQGGMGVVYRATEELAGKTREIALKLIRADRLIDERAVDKLISEGALTQDIRHPNVVAVYNVGQAEGQPFVAMQYVDGDALREWHRRKINAREEIGLSVVSSIISALLDGLEAAHAKGVIHRDLKPENIALTAEPAGDQASLQILDFGIARAPGTVDSMTGTGMGTPRYMAPEQMTNPDAAGPSADLYSLSVIFYELLMDVLPQGHWQPPSGGRTDIPAAIDKLIENGLSNRPGSRPQTAQEYRAMLSNALAGSSDEPEPQPQPEPEPQPRPEPEPGPPPPPKPNKTLRNALIGGGVVVGLLTLIGALGGGGGDGPTPPEDDGYIYIDGEPHFFDENGELVPVEPGDDDVIEPEPTPDPDPEPTSEPPPPPPPPEFTFEDYSGRWNYSGRGGFQVSVSGDGSFSGQGTLVEGTPATIAGNLNSATFAVGVGGVPMLTGALQQGGKPCDLQFEAYNPDGSLNWRDIFHIDHTSGGGCPNRFP